MPRFSPLFIATLLNVWSWLYDSRVLRTALWGWRDTRFDVVGASVKNHDSWLLLQHAAYASE